MTDRPLARCVPARRCVLALVAAFVLSGCAVFSADAEISPFADIVETQEPGAPKVFLVGDSISFVSSAEIAEAFAANGWDHARAGEVGTTTKDNRSVLSGAAEGNPDVVVIQLGTNDVGQATDPANNDSPERVAEALNKAEAEVADALDDLAVVPCVVWVDINTWTNGQKYNLVEAGPAFNEFLRGEAAERDNLHIAPFEETFAPTDAESQAWLERNYDNNGVHPQTPEARTALALLMVDNIRKFCTAPDGGVQPETDGAETASPSADPIS